MRPSLLALMALCAPCGAFVPAARSRVSSRGARLVLSSTTIERPKVAKGTGDPKNKERTGGGGGKHELLLFDDPVNTREFVSRVLCTKCALNEGEAYDCMMQAHHMGVAVVGIYQFEIAENYCTQMKGEGLVAAVQPVGGDGGGDG